LLPYLALFGLALFWCKSKQVLAQNTDEGKGHASINAKPLPRNSRVTARSACGCHQSDELFGEFHWGTYLTITGRSIFG